MEIKPYKLTSIIILLAIAFNITYYMDTHEGRLPWDTNSSNRNNRNYSKNYKRTNYKATNTPKYASKTTKIKYSSANQTDPFKKVSNRNYKPVSSNYTGGDNSNGEFTLIDFRKEFHNMMAQEWHHWDKSFLPDTENPAVIKIKMFKDTSNYMALEKSSGSTAFDYEAMRFMRANCLHIINKRIPNSINGDSITMYVTIGKKHFGVGSIR